MKPKYDRKLFYDWFELPVRFRDLDPLNHVNNANFSTYYEEARIHFIQNVPVLAQALHHARSFVLVTIEINFIKQISYPNTMLIGSGIWEFGNTSVTSFQAIYREKDKVLCSTAKATGVWYDVKKQRPTRLPEITNIEDLLVDKASFNG